MPLDSSVSTRSPTGAAEYRSRLSRGEAVIDPETWAGSMPAAYGVAPRVRIGRGGWFNLLWLLPLGFVALVVGVAVAQGLRNIPEVQRFIARNPGVVTPHAHAGLPWWLNAQHFLNVFFMIFVIRCGTK